ncbi:hypothetical protein DFH09DRAFT_1314664 [Mycena vulgaris]|nr:hypothetical protein DFH09DRAFT_1314664 [Mycena vulgaris]
MALPANCIAVIASSRLPLYLIKVEVVEEETHDAHPSIQSFALLAAVFSPLALAGPVKSDTVLTPGGHRNRASIHAVPAGGRIAHVDGAIHVLAANGSVVHIASPTPAASPPALAKTGWITFASWFNTAGPSIGSFVASWTVPPAPTTWNNQLIYLFNSIEPAAGNAIMQPVLQYGLSPAGGGQFWGVASWYLFQDQVFHTTLVPVSVGQRLDGEVQLIGASGSTFDYNSQFTNLQGTGMSVVGGPELVWATITLEAYGVTVKSDYPAGSTVFSSTSLEQVNGQFPAITWSILNDDADRLATVVNVGGSRNANIEIKYNV